MRTVKIVADSSANLMELKTVASDAAPLKIITAEREFVDDRNLDLDEMISEGKSYEEICTYIPEYQTKTGLLFMLESLNNFAANGRVSPAVAKIAGVLGIRIVGKASDVGTLEPTDKCRGEAKSLSAILKHLKESGLKTGKVILAHCLNESAASTLKNMIETELPGVAVKIGINLGLCSFYAEKCGLLVGFEKC